MLRLEIAATLLLARLCFRFRAYGYAFRLVSHADDLERLERALGRS